MSKPKKRKSFLIDVGNSNTGPIGFCARVIAETKEEAIQKLAAALPECVEAGDYLYGDEEDNADIEYLNVYFNERHLSVKDINDDETEDAEEEDSDE